MSSRRFVPVSDPERPRSEQDPNDPAMQAHRRWDRSTQSNVWLKEDSFNEKQRQAMREKTGMSDRRARALRDDEFLDPFEKRKAERERKKLEAAGLLPNLEEKSSARSRSRSRSRERRDSRDHRDGRERDRRDDRNRDSDRDRDHDRGRGRYDRDRRRSRSPERHRRSPPRRGRSPLRDSRKRSRSSSPRGGGSLKRPRDDKKGGAGGGLREMSVDESNALRIKLGLKPLQ